MAEAAVFGRDLEDVEGGVDWRRDPGERDLVAGAVLVVDDRGDRRRVRGGCRRAAWSPRAPAAPSCRGPTGADLRFPARGLDGSLTRAAAAPETGPGLAEAAALRRCDPKRVWPVESVTTVTFRAALGTIPGSIPFGAPTPSCAKSSWTRSGAGSALSQSIAYRPSPKAGAATTTAATTTRAAVRVRRRRARRTRRVTSPQSGRPGRPRAVRGARRAACPRSSDFLPGE